MRNMLLAACFAVIGVAVITAATPANPGAAPDQAGTAPTLIATAVCGSGGCVQVHTKQEKHRKFQTLGHG